MNIAVGRSTPSPTEPPRAALDAVSKRFGSLQAVDTFSFDVAGGEVHALIGGTAPARRPR